MKIIKLTQGFKTLVDDEDYDKLLEYSWHVHRGRNTRYAVRSSHNKTIRMHREILRVSPDERIDHINRNGLDNRRCNLRVCTRSQNHQNMLMPPHSSRFKGVSWNKWTEKWESRIKANGKNIFLGRFDDEQEAARAYNEAALKYFGEFALVNDFEGR